MQWFFFWFFSTSGQAGNVFSIQLCACDIDSLVFSQLLPTIATCSSLTQLDLRANSLAAATVDALTSSFQTGSSCLSWLHLGNNWMGNSGAQAFARLLRTHKGLLYLNITNHGSPPDVAFWAASRNDCDMAGVRAIIDALSVWFC
jgi:hypothetical protein